MFELLKFLENKNSKKFDSKKTISESISKVFKTNQDILDLKKLSGLDKKKK